MELKSVTQFFQEMYKNSAMDMVKYNICSLSMTHELSYLLHTIDRER